MWTLHFLQFFLYISCHAHGRNMDDFFWTGTTCQRAKFGNNLIRSVCIYKPIFLCIVSISWRDTCPPTCTYILSSFVPKTVTIFNQTWRSSFILLKIIELDFSRFTEGEVTSPKLSFN